MKKFRFFLNLSIIFLLLNFVGCTNYKVPQEWIDEIKIKSSMKPFNHLLDNLDEAPIVVAMPYILATYPFGNTSFKPKGDKRIGDLIVVIDTKTNTVHDWLFYPGEHGWSHCRLAELGTPRKYYQASRGCQEVACLDPSTGKLDIIKTPTYYGWYTFLNNKNKGILLDTPPGYGLNLHLFDTNKTSLQMTTNLVDLPYGDIGSLSSKIQSDPDGNFWFSTLDYQNSRVRIVKLDAETEKIHEYINTAYKEGDGESRKLYNCDVKYVDEKYLLVKHYLLGSQTNYVHTLCVVDIDKLSKNPEQNKLDKKVQVSFEEEGRALLLENVVKVGNDYYVEFQSFIVDKQEEVRFYKIVDIGLDRQKLELVTTHDFYSSYNLYVRGTKIYVMDSRSFSDIKFCYYDVATDTWSETFTTSTIEIGDAWDAELANRK